MDVLFRFGFIPDCEPSSQTNQALSVTMATCFSPHPFNLPGSVAPDLDSLAPYLSQGLKDLGVTLDNS